MIFDSDTLDTSLKGYKKETIGCDVWKPSDLRRLPQQAKSDLSHHICNYLNDVVVPHQNLVSLNALLGKPNGTCRTVCKTTILHRMAMRADSSVRQWENDNLQEYDKASVGSSALLAALKRNLAAEIAHWLGKSFAAVFNDFEKYFDTMDLETIINEAFATKFPLGPLAFSLQQHMAPRVLQANGCSSKLININASILAGCKISVPITRLYKGTYITQQGAS